MLKTPLVILILSAFLITSVIGPSCPISLAQTQVASSSGDFRLPEPGVMVHLSPPLYPPILKGIKVHPDNPFRFDFILDKGDNELSKDQLKQESSRLIKYFLASLTIPEKDLWVNLSPYEKDRIIPQSFGLTEMGRDLLAEDYMLKQITASLIYPEDKIGKKFWKRIYEEAAKRYGTTNIPVNTFNKVWIVPEKAVVYENATAQTAYVVESKLKVMIEQDYLSLEKHAGIQFEQPQMKDTNQLGSQIVREIVIPELTTEVNENKNFSRLRQVYNSLILAAWYKGKIKNSILAKVYEDKSKVAGVNIDDPKEKEKIYQRYLQAFKKGVYNYIKEEPDPVTQETIPRKYFSGGVIIYPHIREIYDLSMVSVPANAVIVSANANMLQTQPSTVQQPTQEPPLVKTSRMTRAQQSEFNLNLHTILHNYNNIMGNLEPQLTELEYFNITSEQLPDHMVELIQALRVDVNLYHSLLLQKGSNMYQKPVDDEKFKALFKKAGVLDFDDFLRQLQDGGFAVRGYVLTKDGKGIEKGWRVNPYLFKQNYITRNFNKWLNEQYKQPSQAEQIIKALSYVQYDGNIGKELKITEDEVTARISPEDMEDFERFKDQTLSSLAQIIEITMEKEDSLKTVIDQNKYLKKFYITAIGSLKGAADLIMGKYELKTFNLANLIEDVWEKLQLIRERNPEFKDVNGTLPEGQDVYKVPIEYVTSFRGTSIRPDSVEVFADRSKLWDALFNIFKNGEEEFSRHERVVTKETLDQEFPKMGLFEWLMANGYIKEHFGEKGHPIHVNDKLKKERLNEYLKTFYPKEAEHNRAYSAILNLLNNYLTVSGIQEKNLTIIEITTNAGTMTRDQIGAILEKKAGAASTKLRSGKGKGLGLISVYTMTEKLGGNFRISTNKEKNSTTFSIALPLPQEELPAHVIAPSAVQTPIHPSFIPSRQIIQQVPIPIVRGQEAVRGSDRAALAKGGIDLTRANMNLQTRNSNGQIEFHLDVAQLAQLENASGFTPVIINIQPLNNLQEFLSINSTNNHSY